MVKQRQIVIETSEKIRFTYPIAEIGTRIAAYLIDELIQIGVILLIAFPLFMSGDALQSYFSGTVANFNAAFLLLINFLIRWFYFIFFEIVMEGQSPGKKWMRIRVIRNNGDPLDLETIVLRNFIRAVDGFPVVPLLGGFVALIDSRNRRLGDLIADTLVVNEIQYNLKLPDFQVRFSHLPLNAEADLPFHRKLSENELYIIRRFLNEYPTLPTDKQAKIAADLASQIQRKLESTQPVNEAFGFLERIYQQHGK